MCDCRIMAGVRHNRLTDELVWEANTLAMGPPTKGDSSSGTKICVSISILETLV